MVTLITTRLNVQKFYIPPTKYTSMIFMVLTTDREVLPTQH